MCVLFWVSKFFLLVYPPLITIQSDLCGITKILQTSVAALIPKMILYVQTKEMAWKLYSHFLGEGVSHRTLDVYHASLTTGTKSRVYREFKSGSSCMKCLIATVAFGMVCSPLVCDNHYNCIHCCKGMDISDVEIVLVYGSPTTTSQLYQVRVYLTNRPVLIFLSSY